MSARTAMVGPSLPPFRTPITPVCAMLFRTSNAERQKVFFYELCRWRDSRLPSSGFYVNLMPERESS